MTEAEATDRAPLDELMLAMDVVDTLRHRQSLIERELGADDRDRDLIERLKAIYSDQGIEVPESVLAVGVEALREDRFHYAPAPPGLGITLAGWYVDRGRIARRSAAAAAVLAALGLGYQYAVQAPAERGRQEEVATLNEGVRAAIAEQSVFATRIARLRESLASAAAAAPSEVAAGVRSRRIEAENALTGAESDLESARGLDQQPEFTSDTVARHGLAEAQLQRQQRMLSDARAKIDSAALALTGIRELTGLPAVLNARRDAALAVAADATGQSRAEDLFGNGIAALGSGDLAAAQAAAQALGELTETLSREYTLRIVSAPGEKSGVWRVPDRNSNARNYYLVVAAVTASGERLALPVTSEEDGRTEVVSQWGVRVSEAVFERVRADKADDGIIRNDRVGAKRRGYLEVDYALPVEGGAITGW